MVATQTLAKVESNRLQKAVEGLCNGAYTITVIRHDADEISGLVANGDGKEYGVTLTATRTFCGCRDAMFRHTTCKHAVALALYVIRNPQPTVQPEDKPVVYNLKLGKARKDFAFSA